MLRRATARQTTAPILHAACVCVSCRCATLLFLQNKRSVSREEAGKMQMAAGEGNQIRTLPGAPPVTSDVSKTSAVHPERRAVVQPGNRCLQRTGPPAGRPVPRPKTNPLGRRGGGARRGNQRTEVEGIKTVLGSRGQVLEGERSEARLRRRVRSDEGLRRDRRAFAALFSSQSLMALPRRRGCATMAPGSK